MTTDTLFAYAIATIAEARTALATPMPRAASPRMVEIRRAHWERTMSEAFDMLDAALLVTPRSRMEVERAIVDVQRATEERSNRMAHALGIA